METNKDYLSRILPELAKEIPSQWRVQSYSKKKPIATVMSYIDARDVMDVLDRYCEYGWHRKHYQVENKVYCEIGVEMPNGTIMWRSDCGVESNTDGEKGQASDSFKRAAVNWGVGRFLYDMPVEYVTASEAKTQSNYPFCVDEQGKQIWDLNKYINERRTAGKTYKPVVNAVTNPPMAPSTNTAPPPATNDLPWLNEKDTEKWKKAVDGIKNGTRTIAGLKKYFRISKETEAKLNEYLPK